MNRKLNAETGISLLLAISLFSILFLLYSEWQNRQYLQQEFLFQQQQALLIAENQINLQLANSSHTCERKVTQNGIVFEIMHCSDQQIKIRFPLGEVNIRKTGA